MTSTMCSYLSLPRGFPGKSDILRDDSDDGSVFRHTSHCETNPHKEQTTPNSKSASLVHPVTKNKIHGRENAKTA